jgi:hypothetical protein
MRTLVYVDPQLMIAVGALLIGSNNSKRASSGASINVLLQTHIDFDRSSSTNLRDLLPEHVFHQCYSQLEHQFASTKEATDALVLHEKNKIIPGTPISVSGILSFPELQSLGEYDPFKPPSINVNTFEIHGEKCFVGALEKDGFRLPIYFLEEAKAQICFLQNEPAEIVGIVKWSPGYKAGGGKSLNMLIRAVALLLG